ncbi:MAG: prepilin-type N-terminal cleavage/methylation domain-containing protein [Campylobacterales bacterium]|nr:prepilin-type N-terminal cleavage/methylation domain-containing protein [Campylobacterales bacterium]
MKKGFTLLELVFVIVVLAIISKFGVELLSTAYKNFMATAVHTTLSSSSTSTVEFIANRLRYRIDGSLIIRNNSNYTDLVKLQDVNPSNSSLYDSSHNVLEWIVYDIDGFRGTSSVGYWSGVIDKTYSFNNPSNLYIYSPGTDTSKINMLIDTLSNGNSSLSDALLIPVAAQENVDSSAVWSELTNFDTGYLPIKAASDGNVSKFESSLATDDFSNHAMQIDFFKYPLYKLVWNANALVLDTATHELWFHYGYQPWKGEKYSDSSTEKRLLMRNVKTFKREDNKNVIRIQVCVQSDLIKDDTSTSSDYEDISKYNVCKEKTIL